jgi:hypothetical protein
MQTVMTIGRFTQADISLRPHCANSDLKRLSKKHRYSITSSAMASSRSATSSTLAVLKLTRRCSKNRRLEQARVIDEPSAHSQNSLLRRRASERRASCLSCPVCSCCDQIV